MDIYDGLKVGGTFHATSGNKGKSFTITEVKNRRSILASSEKGRVVPFTVRAQPNGLVILQAAAGGWEGAI